MRVFRDNYLYLSEHDVKKFPYFLVINEKDDFDHHLHRKPLKGDAEGNLKLWTFSSAEYYQALRYLRKNNIRHWKPVSKMSQFRIATNDRYKIYPESHEQLNPLFIDIETTGLNPETDKIILIVTWDKKNGLRIFKSKHEYDILNEFKNFIAEADFDTLVGHNIVDFDIPFIVNRFKNYYKSKTRQRLIWGVNGGEAYISQHFSQFPYRYGRLKYKRVYINNVDIVDTRFMVMAYDLIKRECQNYKLKYLEEHFGIAPKDRIILTAEEIKKNKGSWELIKYCEQDVMGTKKLYEMFITSYFYQLLFFPMSLEDIIFKTIVPKWDSAIIIDYLANDYSIPLPVTDEDVENVTFEGAITGCLKRGLIKNVRKIDVASLYPSIIIKHHIKSDKDYRDVAYNKFVQITKERLKYKAKKHENKLYGYISDALKYVINPYFGYLGNQYSLYSNIKGASKVTEYGRYYLGIILEEMEKQGAEIIEIDTDGVIYSGEKMADKINAVLPPEIQVEDEGFWSKMISYSKKNYILYNGRRNWVKKGVFFKSSSMNGLKRAFVDDIIDAIFENIDIREVLKEYFAKISMGKCTIDELKQRFRASQSLEEYLQSLEQNSNKNPQLPYEYFIRSGKTYKIEDVVYLYKAREGKKYETMEHEDDFNGVYDSKYYLKMVFGFIEKIYKTAPEIFKKDFLDDYDNYRYLFTGVKPRKKKGGKN